MFSHIGSSSDWQCWHFSVYRHVQSRVFKLFPIIFNLKKNSHIYCVLGILAVLTNTLLGWKLLSVEAIIKVGGNFVRLDLFSKKEKRLFMETLMLECLHRCWHVTSLTLLLLIFPAFFVNLEMQVWKNREQRNMGKVPTMIQYTRIHPCGNADESVDSVAALHKAWTCSLFTLW